ncbi:MAG TPA: hypothetical protein PKC18_16110, partial [Lacipirellulaceae bacterium]|nr:hypothetical protein [Lacipirellulaceae bacterium]
MFTSYKALADPRAAAHAKNRRTPADLRAEAAELADDLQARVDAAKAGAGDFTREEQAAWDRDFQRLGKLTDEIKLAEIDLERRHKLATTSGKPLPQVQGFPMTPTINYVGPALRAFKGSEGLTAAHRTGQWIKAAIG